MHTCCCPYTGICQTYTSNNLHDDDVHFDRAGFRGGGGQCNESDRHGERKHGVDIPHPREVLRMHEIADQRGQPLRVQSQPDSEAVDILVSLEAAVTRLVRGGIGAGGDIGAGCDPIDEFLRGGQREEEGKGEGEQVRRALEAEAWSRTHNEFGAQLKVAGTWGICTRI